MINFFSRVKKAHIVYKNARLQGLSRKLAFILVLYKTTSLVYSKYNIQALATPMEVHDNTTLDIKSAPAEATSLEVVKPDSIIAMSAIFDISKDSETSRETNKAETGALIKECRKNVFIWVIPHCTNIWGGGHYTLFRFVDFFAKKNNAKNIIYLYDYMSEFKSSAALQQELNDAFSTGHFELVTEMNELPPCDAVIATTWQSAYVAKKINARERFYFMQDLESLFYPAGTMALQANYSYCLGFHGVTGGQWLKSNFESYGGKAQAYVFCADRDIFYPADTNKIVRDKVRRIFFYGRPSTARRAYELGIVALEMISRRYPDIEIVIAGLSGITKPNFNCTLLGNLSLRATGDLYRTCDIGIALSATNMSYLPVELMASGCPVVSNNGPQVEWFCKDQFNSLLTAPVPSQIFGAVQRLVESTELRKELALNGLSTVAKTTWEQEMDKIYHYMSQKLA